MSSYEDAVMQSLVLMAEALANPKEITPTLVEAWVLVLQHSGVGEHEIRQGVAKVIQQQTFFPSPADFLKALRPPEDTEAKEELAWQQVRGLVKAHGRNASLSVEDFGGDGQALWALSRLGYAELCSDLSEDNRLLKRAEFVRLYRLAVQQAASLGYLEGAFERQNRGFALTPRKCGRADWHAFPPSRAEALKLPEATSGLVRAIAAMPVPARERSK